MRFCGEPQQPGPDGNCGRSFWELTNGVVQRSAGQIIRMASYRTAFLLSAAKRLRDTASGPVMRNYPLTTTRDAERGEEQLEGCFRSSTHGREEAVWAILPPAEQFHFHSNYCLWCHKMCRDEIVGLKMTEEDQT